jgi:hypothetical protein
MFEDFGRRWIKKAEGLLILGQNVCRMCETKIKEGIIADPQLKQLYFSKKLSATDRRA